MIYHCRHGGKSKVTPSETSHGMSRKNFGCKAKMKCLIHRPSKARLNVFQKYPTIVELDIAHSHDKDRFDVYMNRKQTPATKEKIFNLMEKGHKVSQILTMLTLDLEEELGDEEMKLRRFDNSVRPNRQYIHCTCCRFH